MYHQRVMLGPPGVKAFKKFSFFKCTTAKSNHIPYINTNIFYNQYNNNVALYLFSVNPMICAYFIPLLLSFL